MKKFLTPFLFFLLCLLPSLGMAMELVDIENMKKTHDTITVEVEAEKVVINSLPVLSDPNWALYVGNTAQKVLGLFSFKNHLEEFFTFKFPNEICITIIEKLDKADILKLGFISKDFCKYLLQGRQLFALEKKITTIFSQKHEDEINNSYLLDRNFKKLLKGTQILEGLSKDSLSLEPKDSPLPEVKVRATTLINSNEKEAVFFLKKYEEKKGGFKTPETLQYEKDYIYLSEIYDNDYEKNSCCKICCINTKSCTENCCSNCGDCCALSAACCLISCVVVGEGCSNFCAMFKKSTCQLGMAAILCSPCIIVCSPCLCFGVCICINNFDNIF